MEKEIFESKASLVGARIKVSRSNNFALKSKPAEAGFVFWGSMKIAVWCQIQLGDLLRRKSVAQKLKVSNLHFGFFACANNLIKATADSFD